MSDDDAADQIRAAGALLWRPVGRGAQLGLIHRPKYDDWSFAKGKLEPGEHVLLAAVREVHEETGLRITLGRRLPPVRYLADGLRKRVDYWIAQPGASPGTFAANSEVDLLEWIAVGQARRRLSYAHDAALVADFAARPRQTVPLILVRHAAAGSKSDWRDNDLGRPLDAHGQQQATLLSRLLACFGAGRVLSSPAERCLATVRPFADCAGVPVEVEQALGVPDASAKKAVRQATAHTLAHAAMAAAASAAAADRPVVICAHRENMPLILAAACDRLGAAVPAGPPLRKAGFWVLHHAAGQLVGAERHHPEDDD
jgi:8-oxo-dGTP pyrophosphatase MutT (NUDIX family)/phosphohistidine phosphatase SixA